MKEEKLEMFRPRENRPPKVTVNLPFTIDFGYASQTVPEYKEELLEVLGIKTSLVFDAINTLSYLIAFKDYDAKPLAACIQVLAELGKAMESGTAAARDFFEADNSEELEASKESVLSQPLKAVV